MFYYKKQNLKLSEHSLSCTVTDNKVYLGIYYYVLYVYRTFKRALQYAYWKGGRGVCGEPESVLRVWLLHELELFLQLAQEWHQQVAVLQDQPLTVRHRAFEQRQGRLQGIVFITYFIW